MITISSGRAGGTCLIPLTSRPRRSLCFRSVRRRHAKIWNALQGLNEKNCCGCLWVWQRKWNRSSNYLNFKSFHCNYNWHRFQTTANLSSIGHPGLFSPKAGNQMLSEVYKNPNLCVYVTLVTVRVKVHASNFIEIAQIWPVWEAPG